MKSLIIIKLGGSVITDKKRPFTAESESIKRLLLEIKGAQRLYKGRLIIAHGSGSFGHVSASRFQTHKGYLREESLKGLVFTSDSAIEINRIVVKIAIEKGLKVKSFSPSSFILSKNGKAKKVFLDPIVKTLSIGVVPVVYGDVIMDEEIGFCIFSSEVIISLLVGKLYKNYNIDKIIYCTDTDGVLDEKGNTINKITKSDDVYMNMISGGTKGADVTGGMLHKVSQSISLSRKYSLGVSIINGNKKGELKREILGGKTTRTVIKA